MGYTISLERDIQLTLDAWKRAVGNRDDVRLREGLTPVRNPVTGEVITLGSADGDAEVNVDGTWLPLFRWQRTGRVALDAPPGFEDPDNPVRKLAADLAGELGARLVGEDGEEY